MQTVCSSQRTLAIVAPATISSIKSCKPFVPTITRGPHAARSQRQQVVVTRAIQGEGKDKKFLTREEEPEEYWQTPAEKKGESAWKDPLALIGILAIFFPFVILGIAIATGVVDVNGGR